MMLRVHGAFLLTLGCAAEPVALQHQAELFAPTRGVALSEDGRWGIAGMWETTCDFDARMGQLGSDYDVEDSDDERIVDLREGDVEQGLAVSAQGAFLIERDAWDGAVTQLSGDAADARFGTDGPVVLTSDCAVQWLSDGAEVDAGTSCDGFDVDGDVAWVRADGSLLRVDREGASAVAAAWGGPMRWNAATGAVFEAEGSRVRALDAAGSELWVAELDGDVVAMDDTGARGGVAVNVARGDLGALLFLDGSDGRVVLDMPTPGTADGVVVSGSGGLVGLVLPHAVHLYRAAE